MRNSVLNVKLVPIEDSLQEPRDDVLPLRWSIPVWLVLAAASWAAIYYALSLIF